jgi:ABC-type glycerol-3-phosphate transport system substrate-binding protein
MAIAQLRSFGGEWFATDLDHDCDLLYFRQDLLEQNGLEPAETWPSLLDQVQELTARGQPGIGLPVTHSQQVIDHFVAMAAAFALGSNPTASFWFDLDTMVPAIASDDHRQALDLWRALGQTMSPELHAGSTGDLWQALIDGRVSYLVASADVLPFALERGLDPGALGIAALPGVTGASGSMQRVGNVGGPSWGGVTMSSTGDRARTEATAFLTSLAAPDIQRVFWSDRSTGITPAPASKSDIATMGVTLTDAGWPEQPAADWLTALHATFSNPRQLPALRIAETRRYLQAMEDRIVPFLASDDDSAAETLAAVAADWTAINEAIGTDTQHDLYLRSLMPAPWSSHHPPDRKRRRPTHENTSDPG